MFASSSSLILGWYTSLELVMLIWTVIITIDHLRSAIQVRDLNTACVSSLGNSSYISEQKDMKMLLHTIEEGDIVEQM